MDAADKFDHAVADAQREWLNLTFPPGAITSRMVRIGPQIERRLVTALAPFGLMSGDLDILGAPAAGGGRIRSFTRTNGGSLDVSRDDDDLSPPDDSERRALASLLRRLLADLSSEGED